MQTDLPERTFEFARKIVRLCQRLDEKPGVSRTLSNQLLRSGTSVGANVEEGRASQSEADFVHNTASPAKRPEKPFTGCACSPQPGF